MANYLFLDANGSVLSAGSSVIGGINYPIVKIPDTVSVVGSLNIIGTPSISGQVGASVIGTIPTTQAGTWISSIVSTVPSSVLVGASIMGLTPVAVTNIPSISGTVNIGNNIVASVAGIVGASIIGLPNVNIAGSIAGTYTEQNVVTSVVGLAVLFKNNVSSSVMAAVSPTTPLPVVGSVSGSVGIVGTPSISGAVTVIGNHSISGTVNIAGNPSISGTVNIAGNPSVSGTVQAVEQGTWIVSVVGAFPIGTTLGADTNLAVMGVRNDTLASIVSADKKYTPQAIGPAGEGIVANAPLSQWVSGTASTVSGSAAVASVALIAAQGASIFSYLTSLQLANTGSVMSLITITSGGSVLGYVPAPATGGAIINMPNGYKSRPNASIDISSSIASSVISISAQGFISKT